MIVGWDSKSGTESLQTMPRLTCPPEIASPTATIEDSTVTFNFISLHRKYKLGVKKGKQHSATGIQNYHIIFLFNNIAWNMKIE